MRCFKAVMCMHVNSDQGYGLKVFFRLWLGLRQTGAAMRFCCGVWLARFGGPFENLAMKAFMFHGPAGACFDESRIFIECLQETNLAGVCVFTFRIILV